jgi:hypothetical protein
MNPVCILCSLSAKFYADQDSTREGRETIVDGAGEAETTREEPKVDPTLDDEGKAEERSAETTRGEPPTDSALDAADTSTRRQRQPANLRQITALRQRRLRDIRWIVSSSDSFP